MSGTKRRHAETPWGIEQGHTELAEGVIAYHTASHGGIWLSKERQEQLGYAQNWLKDPAWWEEDCDWSVPYVHFADEIRANGKAFEFKENLKQALWTVERYHPEYAALAKAGR